MHGKCLKESDWEWNFWFDKEGSHELATNSLDCTILQRLDISQVTKVPQAYKLHILKVCQTITLQLQSYT